MKQIDWSSSGRPPPVPILPSHEADELGVLAHEFNLAIKRSWDQAELLRESEVRFRSLFEHAEISIWNEDFSEVVEALNRLRWDGVRDFRKYLGENKDAALEMASMVRVTQVNQATLVMFGAKSEKEFIDSIDEVFGPGALDVFTEELCAI